MDQTSVSLALAPCQGRRVSSYKGELVKVQNLYYGRRYKQCIDLCKQLQRPEVSQTGRETRRRLTSCQIHAVHRTFLWFYHAVSYESMGLLAHDFSGHKIEFLDAAKESLQLALGSLPLPFVSTEGGVYEQAEQSPTILSFAFPCAIQPYDKLNAGSHATEETSVSRSTSSGSFYSTESASRGEREHASPIEQEKAQTPSPHTHTNPQEHSQCNPERTPVASVTHKSRLNQSLSLTHVLEDDLVPSPLFSRVSKRMQINGADENITLKPLPPLPFNHKSSFTMQGSRIVQDPTLRKTAVQTLIARFEGFLPLPPSPQTPSPLTRRLWEDHRKAFSPSPVTPRFRMIRDAFSPDPRNEHLETYLSSTHLAGYNASLTAFRTQLRKQIAYLNQEVDRVQKVQTERTTAKALSKNRFASFWSFDLAASLSKSKETPSTLPSRSRRRRTPANKEDEGDEGDQPAKIKMTERIEKMRREGWKVCKEQHGFKGVKWYDDLRRRVESELGERG